MSYHIYTTKGLTLGSEPRREADRTYTIMTEDLGLVRARAIGVRKERSKLRGLIEPVSLVSVSLVRGQGEWRITNAALEAHVSAAIKGRPEERALARVFALLERLVAGEEAHPELYKVLEEAVTYVLSGQGREAADALEIILVLRMLYELGYVSKPGIDAPLLEAPLDPALLASARAQKGRLIEIVNEGLRSTQLV